MTRWSVVGSALVVVAAALIVACGPAEGESGGDTAEPTVEGSAAPDSFEARLDAARDTTVTFYMWGGSAQINAWIDRFVADRMADLYGIEVERVPMDAAVFVNKLRTEKEAGKDEGVIDLVWINGENFRNAREADLLYGPFTDELPNFIQYVDAAAAETDAGFPIDGYEAPYGRAQFNYDYDTARVPDPPRSFAELATWVQANPGRFTYPQPPDFTGSAFVRQAFYALTGGHEQYLDGFDRALFDAQAPVLWEYFNKIEPFLWQAGESYPRDLAALDTLFERGEVDFTMSFTQTNAASRIADGRYPETVRSLLFTDGSLFNTHFVAIPFNAPNVNGALALANFLMSPEAQLSKNDPTNWGDFTVLSMDRLSPSDRAAFAELDLGLATAPLDEFSAYGVPEIPAEYWEALERGWDANVRSR